MSDHYINTDLVTIAKGSGTSQLFMKCRVQKHYNTYCGPAYDDSTGTSICSSPVCTDTLSGVPVVCRLTTSTSMDSETSNKADCELKLSPYIQMMIHVMFPFLFTHPYLWLERKKNIQNSNCNPSHCMNTMYVIR